VPDRREFVGVRISPASVAKLKAIAAECGVTVSDVIRISIKHGLPAATRELKQSGSTT
jgi:antitoxin component of RelBE/YafQ-DinJ toxin-antitoxin module